MCSYSDFENEYENDRTDVMTDEEYDAWLASEEAELIAASGSPDSEEDIAALFASLELDDFDDDFRNLDEFSPFQISEDDMLRRAQIGAELADELIGETVEELNDRLADLFNSGGEDDKATALLAAHMVVVYFGAILYHMTQRSGAVLDAIGEDIRRAETAL